MQICWEVAGVFHLSWQLPLLSSAPTSHGAAVPFPGFCTNTMHCAEPVPWGGGISPCSISTPNSPTAAAGHGKAAESLK